MASPEEIESRFPYVWGKCKLTTKKSKTMNTEKKKQALENHLKYCDFPAKYFIHAINKGRNSKFIISSKNEIGGLETHSKAMNYDEMNGYIFGYVAALIKPLKP